MTYYEVVKWLESINPILVFIVALMSIIAIGYGFYLWLSKVIFKPRLKLRLPSEYIISRPDTKTRYDHRWGHIEEVVHGKGVYIINIECIAENAKSDKLRLKMTFVKDNQPPTLEALR